MNETDVNTEVTEEQGQAYFADLPNTVVRSHRPLSIMGRSAQLNASNDVAGSQAQINQDAPAIIAFADGVSLENREAVMLGVEFAETVASSKGNIDKNPIQWLKDYAEALKFAGWLTVGGSEYSEYRSSNRNLTMDKVVLEMIAAVAGPNAGAVTTMLNVVINKLEKDKQLMTLFEKNSKKGNQSNFRIMPCLESRTGIPVTYLLAVHATYSETSGRVLFWKWSVSRLNIKRLVKGVNFNKRTFERNEARIEDYLNGSAEDFFNNLP